jgi:hypothetical protein
VSAEECPAFPLLKGESAWRCFLTHASGRLRRSLGRALRQEVTNSMLAGSRGCADVGRVPSRNRGGTGQVEWRSDFPMGRRYDVLEEAALARAWRPPTIRASACRRRAFHVRTCLGPSQSSPLLTGGRIRRDPRLRGPLPAVPGRPSDRPAALPDCLRELATTTKITRNAAHSFRHSAGEGVIGSNRVNQGLRERRDLRHENQ